MFCLADKMKKITSILTLFVLMVVPVFATTINIPGDYPIIQKGIDAASDGDTVLFCFLINSTLIRL